MAVPKLLLLAIVLSSCHAFYSPYGFGHGWSGGFHYQEPFVERPFSSYLNAQSHGENKVYATCAMRPDPTANVFVTGTVDFQQTVSTWNDPLGPLEVRVQLRGFNPNDYNIDHGMHVHQFGVIRPNCTAAGEHFNPLNSVHGGRNTFIRHNGDFGNVREDAQGNIFTAFTVERTSLVGDNSIIGRALVVHEMMDDLGQGGDVESLMTGNSGNRLACCVINSDHYHNPWPQHGYYDNDYDYDTTYHF